jgi:hypothetical protein
MQCVVEKAVQPFRTLFTSVLQDDARRQSVDLHGVCMGAAREALNVHIRRMHESFLRGASQRMGMCCYAVMERMM